MNRKGVSTLGKYEEYLNLKNYSNNTIRVYMFYIDEFVMSIDKPCLHFTIKDIEHYITKYKYSSVSQQNQIYNTIKLFCQKILNMNLDDKIFLERPRKTKILPKVIDYDRVRNTISSIRNLKHKALFTLGYGCGMRISEVLNLKISDIDGDRKIIHIRCSKYNKDRIVPICDKILNLLRQYWKCYKPNINLFNGQKSLKYSSSSCNSLIKKYFGNKYSFHTLRHTYATNLLDLNVNLRTIQTLLGHSSTRTTEIYTHITKNSFLNVPSLI